MPYVKKIAVCLYTVRVKSDVLLLHQLVCSLQLVLGTGLSNAQMHKISNVIKCKAVLRIVDEKPYISHAICCCCCCIVGNR